MGQPALRSSRPPPRSSSLSFRPGGALAFPRCKRHGLAAAPDGLCVLCRRHPRTAAGSSVPLENAVDRGSGTSALLWLAAFAAIALAGAAAFLAMH